MSRYNFYYDESEHSRKINYTTVSASNYYDNFITTIVGWKDGFEKDIICKYREFEDKYKDRKDKNGELKSLTLKQSQFKFGFASLNKGNVKFVDDFLSLYDENTKLYFSVNSKIEYIILQLFEGYKNSFILDADALKYSIIKALNMYQPDEVIKSIYESPEDLVSILRKFFRQKIEANKSNIALKKQENAAFEQILYVLDDIDSVAEIQWNYCMPFDGFLKYLKEEKIVDYSLILDKEGKENEDSNTLLAARKMGVKNVSECNSCSYCGLRMADMTAGIIAKLMKALCDSMRYHCASEETTKKLLDAKWFDVREEQLNLYKKLYKIICQWDNAWFKSYAGVYSDDLVSFIALLGYMSHFKSALQIKEQGLEMQGEYFNSYTCEALSSYFSRRKSKLPIEIIDNGTKDYFYNNQGAKVYYDIKKQPELLINEEGVFVDVLSVGLDRQFFPLVTLLKEGQAVCYKLPEGLKDWAITIVGFANQGENLFPAKVKLSKLNGRYYADIL